MTNAQAGALRGVRVLDLTDERGIYGGKLLGDLGADVVRPEPPGGDPLRERGPSHEPAPGQRISLWYLFFATSRQAVTIDMAGEPGRAQLDELIRGADVVLYCDGAFGISRNELDRALARAPELVLVDITSFGREGPWRDYLAPDLVAGALGGACATTGDVDTPPLMSFGELNFIVSGAYGAIAALSALYHRRDSGEGQVAEISVHEAIASCLEHVFMFYWYREETPVLARQAGLHWSRVYDVIPAKDGTIMVTLTPSADNILAWLIEQGAHQDLLDEQYESEEGPPLRRGLRMMEVLREWVATQEVEPLFLEAQERHIPFGWVMRPEHLAENPQLEARNWWCDYRSGARTVRGPGAPYHMSETPWEAGTEQAVRVEGSAILDEIGWGKRP